jgi:hypothetical protein
MHKNRSASETLIRTVLNVEYDLRTIPFLTKNIKYLMKVFYAH